MRFGRRMGSLLALGVLLLLARSSGTVYASGSASSPWPGRYAFTLSVEDGPGAKGATLAVTLGRGGVITGLVRPVWAPKGGSFLFHVATCDKARKGSAAETLCESRSKQRFVGTFNLVGFAAGVGYTGVGLLIGQLRLTPPPLRGAVMTGRLYHFLSHKSLVQGGWKKANLIGTFTATRTGLQSSAYPACTEKWWNGTWNRVENPGETVTFTQGRNGITSGSYTFYGGGSFSAMKLSPDCRTMTGAVPTTKQITQKSYFEIHLDSRNHFTGNWRWATTTAGRWDGPFSGTR